MKTNQHMSTSTTSDKIHDSDDVDVNGKVYVQKRMKKAKNQTKIRTKINLRKLQGRKSHSAEDSIPSLTHNTTSNHRDSTKVTSVATDIDSSSRPKHSQKIKGHNRVGKVIDVKLDIIA